MALIPPHYLDAVVAIGVGDDPEERKWIGTGFLYGLLSGVNAGGPNRHFICLTTNAHVLCNKSKVWRIRNYSR